MLPLFTMFIYPLAIALFIFAQFVFPSTAETKVPAPHIDLALSFDTGKALLRGTMKTEVTAGHPISFRLDGLTVTGTVISSADEENRTVALQGSPVLSLEPTPYNRTLLISYEKAVTDDFRDIISPEAIVLSSLWHPLPDRKSTFGVKAQVPPGFTAVCESDSFSRTSPDGSAYFSFSQPVYSLTFAAAPYRIKSSQVRDNLLVHALFFPEDQHLAGDYLSAAVDYIKRYEKLIGPFPYNHYLIVENVNPTGFGIPTFTLLGRQVLRLPFIKETSLGHEILHSWFGNSIGVSLDSGNWCEGLTTYLADMAYREDGNDGPLSRKEKLQEYSGYVKADTAPLIDFRYAGHGTDGNRAVRAVGYGKSAMLFHELKIRLGEEVFLQGIQRFYQKYRGSEASWQDIENLFASLSPVDLQRFFSERLNSVELPELAVGDVRVAQESTVTSLSFTIEQKSSEPFELLVPYTVKTIAGTYDFTQLVTEKTTRISVELEGHPLELSIDEHYDLMRELSDREYVPLWSQLLGGRTTTVILADERERAIYQPVLDMASRYSWQIKDVSEPDSIDTSEGFLIFLGLSSPLSRVMYGTPQHPATGFTLDVRSHPSKLRQPVALVSSSSSAESINAVSRLSHYGKYSFLHFNSGTLSEKNSRPADNGIRITITEAPGGVATSRLMTFSELVDTLSRNQVIYIGETHTSRADHLLQLMIIEALHSRNPDLAIGMEMFPRSSQDALDRYIQDSTVGEALFLRESRYHEVWGYDFRLFRPIFTYAKKHRIDVIGLNAERKTVSSVFKSNGLDGLTPEQRSGLPADRVLDMDGYAERLGETFSFHGSMEEDSGSFHGFIQAQAIWDETMAESIHDYLLKHPTSRMVVLAGSQHTRKDSGIPPRVERRKTRSQASVLNLATSMISAAELTAASDYLFFLETADFPPQGRIGVVLQENQEGSTPGLQIIEVNPGSDAAAQGVLKNDVLTHIGDRPVGDMDDVRTVMLDKSVGEIITIMVKRVDEDNSTTDHSFSITLFNPDIKKAHP